MKWWEEGEVLGKECGGGMDLEGGEMLEEWGMGRGMEDRVMVGGWVGRGGKVWGLILGG